MVALVTASTCRQAIFVVIELVGGWRRSCRFEYLRVGAEHFGQDGLVLLVSGFGGLIVLGRLGHHVHCDGDRGLQHGLGLSHQTAERVIHSEGLVMVSVIVLHCLCLDLVLWGHSCLRRNLIIEVQDSLHLRRNPSHISR